MRPYKRSFTNYFIDKRFQTKYVLLTILLLLAYTFIFTIILFLPSILTLLFDYPLAEKAEAARTFLVLHGTVWPTTCAVIFIFGILSIFLTHRIAGPIYRLKHALTELTGGNLDNKIKLRRWDDFQELAEQVNLLADELRSYTNSLKRDHELLSNYIEQLEREIGAESLNTEAGRKIIGQVQEQKKAIAVTLKRFSSKS
jgi:nitrogen fixation/metabolism regulation signal transduction histidine kinase